MEIICRGRRGGKTFEAIKRSARYGYTIVCLNFAEVKRIEQIAKEIGAEIPKPVTYDKFISKETAGVQGYVIDNADALLQRMAGGRPIQSITLTHEYFENLYVDHPQYMTRLMELDPKQRKALLEGDWETGEYDKDL